MTQFSSALSEIRKLASDQVAATLHVAVIMDGNGRWARARGLPRTVGHRQGVEAARKVIKAAA
jgi:undecaprenyl diphosphate synthase